MIRVANSKAAGILVIGDLVTYLVSLILTLYVRYGEIPTRSLLSSHLSSFVILFIISVIVGFSAGLYDKQSSFMRGRIPSLLVKVQLVNIFAGIAFFYLAPVSIAPKANLIIYFIISTALLFVWRMIVFPVVSVARIQSAIIVGEGADIEDLHEEINGNVRYGLSFTDRISPGSSIETTAEAIGDAIQKGRTSVIVADLRNPTIESAMPFFYSLIFSGTVIIDAAKLYEAIFDRIPLSLVGERWLVENAAASLGSLRTYDVLKRSMDIVLSGLVALISLILYPFVYIAVKIDDRGPVFIAQDRVGKMNKPIRIYKFRSMTANDGGEYGRENNGKTQLRITRVGRFIRLSRIDELPQLWNVLKGDISLIGPRPELPDLAAVYEKEIPYYNVRHLIKPGLSGWAQIRHHAHPHHAISVDLTRDKLSYDLYYIKNRSLSLDLKIAIQTLRALLSRQGV